MVIKKPVLRAALNMKGFVSQYTKYSLYGIYIPIINTLEDGSFFLIALAAAYDAVPAPINT